mmetsp:Transcript_94105/g.298746  ORF Transcript_94105/g.298746 Transcript_94105/m.298746 type:complete len:216 (-) Transcript_94105:618-1265(-)
MQSGGGALLHGDHAVVAVLCAGAIHRVDAVPEAAATPGLAARAELRAEALGGRLVGTCKSQDLLHGEAGGCIQQPPEALHDPGQVPPLCSATSEHRLAKPEVVPDVWHVGLRTACQGAEEVLPARKLQVASRDEVPPPEGRRRRSGLSPELQPMGVRGVRQARGARAAVAVDLQVDRTADGKRLEQAAPVPAPGVHPRHTGPCGGRLRRRARWQR